MAIKNMISKNNKLIKTSTYYRHRRAKKMALKRARNKYLTIVALLLVLPSLIIGYFSHRLTIELKVIQTELLKENPVYGQIRAKNEESKKDNEVLNKYEKELASLGEMGTAIKNASIEFGQDADEAVLIQGLMLGIANAESSMGKNFHVEYDKKCFNWWGLKGGRMTERTDGSSLRCFVSAEAGARTMAKTLKLYYLNEGKDTPEKIVTKYVGSNWGQYHDQWVANVKKYAK